MSREIFGTAAVFGDFRDRLRERWEQARRYTEEAELMGHVISPIPNSDNGPKLVAVDDETREELEGIFTYLSNPENKGQVGYGKFDTAEELAAWLEQARSWAVTRTPKVIFRKLPAKNLPETELKFAIREGEVGKKADETPETPAPAKPAAARK